MNAAAMITAIITLRGSIPKLLASLIAPIDASALVAFAVFVDSDAGLVSDADALADGDCDWEAVSLAMFV